MLHLVYGTACRQSLNLVEAIKLRQIPKLSWAPCLIEVLLYSPAEGAFFEPPTPAQAK